MFLVRRFYVVGDGRRIELRRGMLNISDNTRRRSSARDVTTPDAMGILWRIADQGPTHDEEKKAAAGDKKGGAGDVGFQ